MDHANWQKVETIIDGALELPEEKRRSFVDAQCRGDAQLKSEVTLLLESIFESEGWLESPEDYKEVFYKDISHDVELLAADFDLLGKSVGAYTIKEQIGQGGMGRVYMAERTDGEFGHRVALKIIRQEKVTNANIKRFRREQHILAALNHPGIARLFDGGFTEDGAPYIIMEYVDGIPVDDYCRTHDCSLEEKISLLKQVLNAVGYAHENLTIHRDLKPANILVNQDGNIKILDFGIAKLLQEDDNQIADLTRTGARLLTPRYAAPEQVKQQNITTAADLYAIGIIFYKLLTECFPFDFDNLSPYEIEQIILHKEPAKPSGKVSFKGMNIQLQGDLDAIALKAIRKEPEQRYRVAKEFLDDLNNYQQSLPVSAREDSFKYRSQKFIKRHKQSMAVATGIFVLITGFAIFYNWQITEERNQAQFEAERALQVKDFMLSIFNSSNPVLVEHSVKDLTANQLLKSGILQVDQKLKDQPAIYIELMNSIGLALRNLDDFEGAVTSLQKALAKCEEYYGTSSIETATILNNLANTENSLTNYENAQRYLKRAIHITGEKSLRNNITRVHSFSILAQTYAFQGKYQLSQENYLKADRLYVTTGNSESLGRFNTLDNLAEVEQRLDEYDLAEKHLKQTLKFYNKYYDGPHINTSSTQRALGALYSKIGEYNKANTYLLKALDTQIKLLGKNSTKVASTYSTLSINSYELRALDKAQEYADESLKINKKFYGVNSIPYVNSLNNVALVQKENGKYGLAKTNYKNALKIKESLMDAYNPSLAIAYYSYGEVLIHFGEYDQSSSYLKKAIKIDKKVFGEHSVDIGIDYNKLASVLTLSKDYGQAAQLFEKSREILIDKLPKTHKRIAENLVEFGKLKLEQKNFTSAKTKFEEALSIYRVSFNENDSRIKNVKNLLGETKKMLP